jgi:hypothetical protein
MKICVTTLLKICHGTYFILASLYCFLAFTPFTYLFVIVTPPYRWILTFAHYNVLFLWIATAASILSQWPQRSKRISRIIITAEFSLAVILSIHSPISQIRNNLAAFAWGIGFLLPVLIRTASDFMQRASSTREQNRSFSIPYSDAFLIGFLAGLISIAVLRLQAAIYASASLIQAHDVELMLWVLVEHMTLAIFVASIINLIRSLLFSFTRKTLVLGPGIIGLVFFIGLAFGCFFFMEDSLALRGWAACGYAVLFAATLTLYGLTQLMPVFNAQNQSGIHRWLCATIAIFLMAPAFYVLVVIDPADDWNGLFHKTFTLLLWVALAFLISLRSLRKQYSIGTILAVAVATWGVYAPLNHFKPLWAVDLGANKALVQRELNNYSERNASFALVDTVLGNQKAEPCDAACKTLRQYSNIRNATIGQELNLVDNLSMTTGPRPNIFIIVVDSLRPDYLGAYNPRVDFTPNIDTFAHDSIVMRHAYTDYAGTSLSEPSIWSGALLLHAHYAQPFQKVNSLERLARTDGYEMVITYDAHLRELIAPNDVVKLDMDKKTWGQVEISSTIRQLEDFLDHRPPQAPPVFFYTQAMNVQLNADNDLPKRTSHNWRSREAFDDRIAYTLHQADESLGAFFAYLKSKNLYDNSIIILTADHGDATLDLGRKGHSTIIYPEIMRVPLIFHLPNSIRGKYAYDENKISALIDIAPSLYYLLGHRPIKANPLVGNPMFLESVEECRSYYHADLFLASDSIAAYGILAGDGRWMYTTYDSPSRSMLFDLVRDPNAQYNVLTPELKRQYDNRILQYLQLISRFYGHKPTGG